MFMSRSRQSHADVEALELWRAAAHVPSLRAERFLGAAPDMRAVAFTSNVAALDSEEPTAANFAPLSLLAAA